MIHAGAGLRVRKTASTATLQKAIGQVLDDHRYRAAARRMAAILAAERDDRLVIDELERAAKTGSAEREAFARTQPRHGAPKIGRLLMRHVAVLGTGKMGAGIARSLLRSGLDVSV